jgi:hypothetical protein
VCYIFRQEWVKQLQRIKFERKPYNVIKYTIDRYGEVLVSKE